MLVDVGVDFALRQGGVGLNKVAELDQPHLEARLLGHALGHFGNLRMRPGGHADGDTAVGGKSRQWQGGRCGERSQGMQSGTFLHRKGFLKSGTCS